jgi:hypothetical protein
MELCARYFHRGCKMLFTNDGRFFNCEIESERGLPVGGVLAAVHGTTPDEFLARCKQVVEKSFAPTAKYLSGGTTGTNEKRQLDNRGGRR